MRKWILSAALLGTLAWGGSAAATNGMFSAWQSAYPDSASSDAGCRLCHQSVGDPWNAYGWAIKQNLGVGFAAALVAVEGLDSDLDPDGWTNREEIDLSTQPGWTPGPNNTIYFLDLSTLPNQNPPSQISGLLLDPLCGDGSLDPGEECDDGNLVEGDGCDTNCSFTACGNGITTTGEQCDDNNTDSGDCCSPTCQFEAAGQGTPDCCSAGMCQIGVACGPVCFGTGECKLGGASGRDCICGLAP